jgi:MFS family permease
VITPGLVRALGASQLLCWGISYYLVAIFADPISSETGWPLPVVDGGFSAALVVMGLVSPAIGGAIDRFGGRPVMTIGSCLIAVACVLLSAARSLPHYYAAWLVLGLAMRMTLYDAAFATLARIGGPKARQPISQITLLGGLASTALWPLGQFLIETLGWRQALWVYAALSLATVPLHRLIPADRCAPEPSTRVSAGGTRAGTRARTRLAAVLFATGLTCTTFLASALSAHMISLLSGLGLATTSAVWISTFRGLGQSSARLCEVLFGRHLDPLMLGVVAAGLTIIGVVFAFWGGISLGAALAFSLLFGSGNGLATIVRGTQPLILFGPRSYGALNGFLMTPSFFISAGAPTIIALLVEARGPAAAIILALLCALGAFVSAAALWLTFK